jgi:hypothetical protein
VRRAFRDLGHAAWSCDLLESVDKSPYHFPFDIRNGILTYGWDLMIAHPPCTDLAVSGAKWFKQKREDGRQQAAIDFVMTLANAPIPRICIENPVGVLSTHWRKPDQIVQPYLFGDEATKTTCLWLKNLPNLLPTEVVGKGARHVTKSGRSLPVWYNLPPGPNRAMLRSLTFPGIALAMASQWGGVPVNSSEEPS